MPAKEIISSESVRLFEGAANDLIPKAKLPRDMHGFAIVVPGGDAHEWILDLLWRVTILYAAQPGILKSRAKVAKIVESVMRAAGRPKSEFENSLNSKVAKPGRNVLHKAARKFHKYVVANPKRRERKGVLMADTTPSSIEERMMEDAKKDVRESGQFLTAPDLAEFFNFDHANLQSRLDEWVTRGEIFSIHDESAGELFPLFAFDRNHGIRPSDAIAKVLLIFGDRLSDWAIALWFIGLNSYLDDQCPKDLVATDPDWVIEAAQDEIDEVAHG